MLKEIPGSLLLSPSTTSDIFRFVCEQNGPRATGNISGRFVVERLTLLLSYRSQCLVKADHLNVIYCAGNCPRVKVSTSPSSYHMLLRPLRTLMSHPSQTSYALILCGPCLHSFIEAQAFSSEPLFVQPLICTTMLFHLSILFALCAFVLAQTNDTTSTNYTSIYVPDCNMRNPDCDGRGVCLTDGTCRCWYGFFGSSDKLPSSAFNTGGLDNCALRADMIPGFREAYTNIRIYQGVFFGFLALVMLYRIILEYLISFSRGSTDVVTKYTMILLTFLCVCESSFNSLFVLRLPGVAILSGDFFGAFGTMNVKAYYVMYYFKDNLFLFVFSALLFHWAELYYASIRKMKKEEMLRKIKPGYEPNLQMEDILLKISLVSKFRFGYVAVCALSLLVFVGQILLELCGRSYSAWDSYSIFYYGFYTGVWILFSIGYIVYGLRLIQIIPEVMQGKIVIVMILMGFFTLFGVIIASTNIAFHANHATISLASIYALATMTCLMAFSSVNVFIPIWQWHRWLNPRVIRSMIRSTNTTGNTSGMKTQDIVV
ncbi:hypothetical protein PROFUN_09602 [Planoprotostelium fungivorum]|uniref:Transmembrane protein n=1 Tax=Planoprotostelium fungivorum TaxID=1890364 RepID=A0A2P6NGU3_9EUKA|nr:hypothetical protein PROFUN_09602 [Planoprotostelium fungivorum]